MSIFNRNWRPTPLSPHCYHFSCIGFRHVCVAKRCWLKSQCAKALLSGSERGGVRREDSGAAAWVMTGFAFKLVFTDSAQAIYTQTQTYDA